MIVHGVVAVHREDSAKRVSVNGVNSNAVGNVLRNVIMYLKKM